MKASKFLEQQHRQLDKLFEQLEDAKNSQRKKIFDELAGLLVGHDAIEREIFYPACEKKMGMTDDLGEALAEHGLVEFSLFRADTAGTEKDFKACVTVLQEVLEHHIGEEEREFFPRAERALGADLSKTITEKMEERFAKAQEEDFRVGLLKNLRQVIDGAVKTSKRVVKKPKGLALAAKTAKKAKKARKSKKKGGAKK
jgi:Hemerythrin HHE cation binding domain